MIGPPNSALAFPEPLDEDDDDIRWALQTAAVQWRRGAREDAIAWLRRGADAAVDGGFWERASQLNVQASQLERTMGGVAEPEALPPPSAPKIPPRAPSPVSYPWAPQSSRPALPVPVSPVSVRGPAPSTTSTRSRWPTGFPSGAPATSTPSGRAIAPPPPVPASVRAVQGPIPPPPGPIASRDSNRLSVEIQLGQEEELDISEAEYIELQEDATIDNRQIADERRSTRQRSSNVSAPAFESLPSYAFDEDPLDGTTSLPPASEYPAAYAPDAIDEQTLPAFPLEDSAPAAAPTQPPAAQPVSKISPLPQFSASRSPPPASDSSPYPSSMPTSFGAQRFSRPVSRVESQDSTHPTVATAATHASAFTLGNQQGVTSRKTPSISPIGRREPSEFLSDSQAPFPISDDDSLLQPISTDDLKGVSEAPAFGSEEPATFEIPAMPSVAPAAIAGGELAVPPTETPIPSSASSLKGISIRGIALSDVRGLCDLPEDSHRLLRQRARIERMGTGEDLSFFSVVLVLEGWVKLMPAIADVTCANATAGEVVFTQGTLDDGVALRVVAGQNGTTLATWDRQTFNAITDSCPWVADELRLIADSFQALAGTTLGMLGERLDDALREVVTSRCKVLTLLPHEILVSAGNTVPGMHIVGAGLVEILDATGTLVSTSTPGDFLLTAQVLAGGASPHTARAGSSGALVLFAPRIVAHELLVSVPPLLEILAG